MVIPGFEFFTRIYRSLFRFIRFIDDAAHRRLGLEPRTVVTKQERLVQMLGDICVPPRREWGISQSKARAIRNRLQPGDIILTRRTGFISNIAMPGFWKHCALYVGDAERRARVFDSDEMRAWVRTQGIASGNFEELLARDCPEAYIRNTHAGDDDCLEVVECTGAGVILETLAQVGHVDALGVLRPRLGTRDKAQAVARAMVFYGTPYDYLFDFGSDEALICSELIYRAYGLANEGKGLGITLREVAGRPVLATNDLVLSYARRDGEGTRAFDLVLFLHGDGSSLHTYRGGEDDFALSAYRSPWGHPSPAGPGTPTVSTEDLRSTATVDIHETASEAASRQTR